MGSVQETILVATNVSDDHFLLMIASLQPERIICGRLVLAAFSFSMPSFDFPWLSLSLSLSETPLVIHSPLSVLFRLFGLSIQPPPPSVFVFAWSLSHYRAGAFSRLSLIVCLRCMLSWFSRTAALPLSHLMAQVSLSVGLMLLYILCAEMEYMIENLAYFRKGRAGKCAQWVLGMNCACLCRRGVHRAYI